MNFGGILFNIIQAMITFGSNVTKFFNTKIDISAFLKVLNSFGINSSSIPTEITAVALLGGLGGTALLIIFVLNLIRG